MSDRRFLRQSWLSRTPVISTEDWWYSLDSENSWLQSDWMSSVELSWAQQTFCCCVFDVQSSKRPGDPQSQVKSGQISCPRQFSFESYLRERLGHIVVCVVEVDRNIWLMKLGWSSNLQSAFWGRGLTYFNVKACSNLLDDISRPGFFRCVVTHCVFSQYVFQKLEVAIHLS